jgi:hypothetical protein
MAEDELDAGLIRFALAPSGKPPRSMVARNIVCKCADASDVQIGQELAAGAISNAAGKAEVRHLLRRLLAGHQADGGRICAHRGGSRLRKTRRRQ